MKNTSRLAKIVKNKGGNFFIETDRGAIILKRATPPVESFPTRRAARLAATRMGYFVPVGRKRFFWVNDNWSTDNSPGYVATSSNQALHGYLKDHKEIRRKSGVRREIKITEAKPTERIKYFSEGDGCEITETVKTILRHTIAGLPIMAICDGSYC